MKKRNLLSIVALAGTSILAVASLVSCGSSDASSSTAINVYTRDTTSGTREGFFKGIDFEDAASDDSVLVDGYVEVSSNGTMMSSIENDEYGVGYISLSGLDESGLTGLYFDGVAPTEDNVNNDTYELTRNFNWCKRSSYDDESHEEIVDAFIAYMSTTEGKATIADNGGIIATSDSDESWSDISSEYPICDEDNSDITIEVGGSTSVEEIVDALLLEFSAKCGNFQYSHDATGSGDAYKRTNGTEKDGANACDLAFASREFNDDEVFDSTDLYGKMCTDAIVMVVNPDNSFITNITPDVAKDIYDGTVTTWEEVESLMA